MKYMLMILGTQADYDAMSGKPSPGSPVWSESELKAMFQHMESLNNDLAESGEWVDGQGLTEPAQAVSVTATEDGRPVVSDGPYGEAEEVLCGYWVVDCENLERVTEIAARVHACPGPEGVVSPPVIVRPVQEGPPAEA